MAQVAQSNEKRSAQIAQHDEPQAQERHECDHEGDGWSAGANQGIEFFSCPDCPEPAVRDNPVAAPSSYAFNYEVIVDCIEVADYDANKYIFLSAVCNGTTMHAVGMVMLGKGVPKSSKCWDKFHTIWISWAGYPSVVTTDRGLHNRGAFCAGAHAGVCIHTQHRR